jgi:hypothetical protein
MTRGLGLVHARLSAVDCLAGRRVSNGSERGVASGIDLDGRLAVRLDDGSHAAWISGEVSAGRE